MANRSGGADWAVENVGKYEDKGLIIDASNMAAGATVYSQWYDGVDWVRNFIAFVSSDQNYDLIIQRRDSTLTMTGDAGLASGQTPAAGFFRAHQTGGANALLGYSVRFAIKNSSASPNTYGRVRLQLMGL